MSDFLHTFVHAIEREQLPYALIGAFAMLARNASRTTFDVDFLTTDRRALTIDWRAATGLQKIDVRRGDFDDPLAGVIRFTPPNDLSFDLIVGKWKWQAVLIDRAEPLPIKGLSIRVATPADLCLTKIDAGGPKDLRDVDLLLERNPAAEHELVGRLPSLPQRLRIDVEAYLAQRR